MHDWNLRPFLKLTESIVAFFCPQGVHNAVQKL